MARRLLTISMLFLVGPLLLSCGERIPGTVAKIHRERMAYIATVPFEPPLIYQKEGEMVGPDAELGRRIVARLTETRDPEGGSEVRLTWINRTYPNLLPAMRHGEVDMVIGVFEVTEERLREIDFSDPYYVSDLVLVINPVHRDLRPGDFAGIQLGVREGTGVEEFVRRTYPSSVVVLYKTLDDAVLSLRRSEIDAVIDDRYMAAYSLATTPGTGHMEIVPTVLGTLDVAVGVKKGDRPLLEIINPVIAAMREEGEFARLLEEHQGEDHYREVASRLETRLAEEEMKKRERQISISVSRAPNYQFDIYRMANLRFIFRNQTTGSTIQTSLINFEGRIGRANARVPPGTYTLSLPQFNFSHPVEILPQDSDQVSINIVLSDAGVVVRKG